jgi:hypothetical protein
MPVHNLHTHTCWSSSAIACCLQGFCSLLIQRQPQQALVTSLEEYKQMGSAAPAHLAMTCYTELASSHGLVLVRGDVLRPELINAAEVGNDLLLQLHYGRLLVTLQDTVALASIDSMQQLFNEVGKRSRAPASSKPLVRQLQGPAGAMCGVCSAAMRREQRVSLPTASTSSEAAAAAAAICCCLSGSNSDGADTCAVHRPQQLPDGVPVQPRTRQV